VTPEKVTPEKVTPEKATTEMEPLQVMQTKRDRFDINGPALFARRIKMLAGGCSLAPLTRSNACLTLWLLTLVLLPVRQVAGTEAGAGAKLDYSDISYPVCDAVVNVTQAPYFAKGDGVSDDTDAIQRALSDVMGARKLLYFPNGTYLVSRTLNWTKKNASGAEAWGMNFLMGQNVGRTIIRLKEGALADRDNPGSIMWCGGFGSADWFHNYVENITFDVGDGNPGAIGLQFYSNNSGAVRNCRFLAGEGSGLIGLDLGHRDMNGPLLVRNCEVIGYQRGISAARGVNSQTFEYITLRNQSQFGLDNEGQPLSIRGLLSVNAVPAVRSYGTLCLLDAKLIGQQGAKEWPAIINYNGGRIFVRDAMTSGYRRAIGDVQTPDWTRALHVGDDDQHGSLGPNVVEYTSHPVSTAFESERVSLRLPVNDPPAISVDSPATWANVDRFGADPTAGRDSSAAIQRAIDSGATTIFLPGSYLLNRTVIVRGRVQRIVGIGGAIDYFSQIKPDFRIVDGEPPAVSIEHFANIHGGIEIDTQRTVLFRSVSDCDLTFTDRAQGGELFFEDFVTHDLRLTKQRVWARQLNVENEGTHIVNDGGSLWVLGYKSERGGTLLETRRGGRSEILGGFSYTTTAGKLAPMFVTHDASIFTFFSEVCFNGDPFLIRIQETRGSESRQLSKDQAHTAPYSGWQK
jgi:hypothetical protein